MLANGVEQTTTTATNGNLTLIAAAVGRRSFHEVYGTGQPFPYGIDGPTGNLLELGLGRMLDATTLVREWVWQTNNGGTWTEANSASGQLTLPAGTKTVSVRDIAHQAGIAQMRSIVANNATANQRIVIPDNVLTTQATTMTMAGNRLYGYPAYFSHPINVDAFALRAGASGTCDFGLHRMKSDMLPGETVVSVTGVAVVSGMNFATFSSRWLLPGWYVLDANSAASLTAYQAGIKEGYGRSDVATLLATVRLTQTQGTVPNPFGTPTVIGELSAPPNIGLRHV